MKWENNTKCKYNNFSEMSKHLVKKEDNNKDMNNEGYVKQECIFKTKSVCNYRIMNGKAKDDNVYFCNELECPIVHPELLEKD